MSGWSVVGGRLVIVALVAGLLATTTGIAVAQTPRFPDVLADHYAFEAVEWAAEVGVTRGYDDGTFKPARPLSRRHAVVFMQRYYDEILGAEESEDFTRADMMVLLKAINDGTLRDAASGTGAGSAPGAQASPRFPDVPVDHYAFEAVEWAAEVGVTRGYDDGTFKPARPLSRRHAVVFMERYYDEILGAEESEDFTRADMMVLLKAINDGTIGDTTAGAQPGEEAQASSAEGVVAAGEWHSCGVRADGTVTCWGSNEHLVYDESQPRWIADGKLDAPSGQFLSVVAGPNLSCGLLADQTVACWGADYSGQLDPPSDRFLSVDAGGHACGMRVDQTVTCWGGNFFGQSDAPSGQFLSVAAGSSYSCAIRADQSVTCWGDNTLGQLDAPTGQFSHIVAGSFHTCGMQVDQSLTCWGSDQGGVSNVPEQPLLSVAAGNAHTCGILLDRTLVCWDPSFRYYAGTGEIEHESLERDPNVTYIESAEAARRRLLESMRDGLSYLIAPAGEFLYIDAGVHHTCGVRVDRTAVCWGVNEQGQSDAPSGRFGP